MHSSDDVFRSSKKHDNLIRLESRGLLLAFCSILWGFFFSSHRVATIILRNLDFFFLLLHSWSSLWLLLRLFHQFFKVILRTLCNF